ncbi:MAG TPA: SUKH-3 domain-containing protein [Mycobacteriales bacterium]|nr:SUKH-3 domain-containing protein [Mycobacteriales bacterium]
MAERFAGPVVRELRKAGWSPGRRVDCRAMVGAVCERVGRHGARLEAFAAATAVLEEFGSLYVGQDGPGIAFRRRPFAIEAAHVTVVAETLTDFGRVLRTRLFPIGMEGDHDSILAVDEAGRVFALDHGGEWFLGESIDAALSTLITGADQPRVRDDGTW